MPLASDLDNTAFVGAQNPDANLHVEIYEYERNDPQWKGKPFIRIIAPGDKTSVYDQPLREDHKERFPRHWAAYQRQNGLEAIPFGTSLEQWAQDDPDSFGSNEIAELKALRFQYVEQIANASDGQIQKMPLGALALKERARVYLTKRIGIASAAASGAVLDEIAELKAQVAMLRGTPHEPQPVRRRGPNKKKRAVRTDHAIDHAPTGDAGHG